MAKLSSKTKWILAGVVVLGVAFFGFKWWKGQQYAVPDGIASGNRRLEAKLVDATAKELLRVKGVLVDEGDLVQPGQVVVRLDSSTLDAQLASARGSEAAALEQLAVAQGAIDRRKAEINLARIEVDRSGALVKENAGSQRELDVRRSTLSTTPPALT